MKEFERQREEINKLNTESEGRWKTAQVDDTTDLQLSDEIVITVSLPWT